jgi:hypothetical protein
MRNRYRLFLRDKHAGGKTYWCQDYVSGKRESLKTKDKAEAIRLLDLKNQPHHFAGFHVQMARTHLMVSDPQSSTRTWQMVMDAIIKQKTGSTKERWERAAKSKSLDPIRNLIVASTKADEFLAVLDCGKVSANVYLRRLHSCRQQINSSDSIATLAIRRKIVPLSIQIDKVAEFHLLRGRGHKS